MWGVGCGSKVQKPESYETVRNRSTVRLSKLIVIASGIPYFGRSAVKDAQ